MISTSEITTALTLSRDREKVAGFLHRQEVQKELVKYGVNPADAEKRLASLSDVEVHKLAKQIENSAAGGDAIVISLTTILIIVLLVLLLR
jgi:hypothetical protein